MGVGAIGAIGAYNQVSYIRPLNYKLQNTSEVSSSYVDSINKAMETSDPVDAVSPVGYPTAEKVSSSSSPQSAKAANALFNGIASAFSSSLTGYSANGAGNQYSVVGNNIDLFA